MEEKEESNATEIKKVPADIHFIWVGGPIRPKYLENIAKVARVAERSGFNINLWVDDDMNYIKTSAKENIVIPNLRLRNINELAPIMRETSFYQKEDRFKKYWEYLNRELVGFKNFATAADLLRFEILRQEGGYYFDTDIEFKLDETLDNTIRFVADEVPYGIKAHVEIHFRKINGKKFHISFANVNCDILATEPNHPVMKLAVAFALKKLEEWDNHKMDHNKYGSRATAMDAKRSPFQPKESINLRRALSILIGPGSLRDALSEVYPFETKFQNIDKVKTMRLGKNPVEATTAKKILGITVINHCDKTWLEKKRGKHKFFESEDIISKTNSATKEHLFNSLDNSQSNTFNEKIPKKVLSENDEDKEPDNGPGLA